VHSDSGCCWLNELPGSTTMRDATCPLFVGALTHICRAWLSGIDVEHWQGSVQEVLLW
jgi:hypothetical protein